MNEDEKQLQLILNEIKKMNDTIEEIRQIINKQAKNLLSESQNNKENPSTK